MKRLLLTAMTVLLIAAGVGAVAAPGTTRLPLIIAPPNGNTATSTPTVTATTGPTGTATATGTATSTATVTPTPTATEPAGAVCDCSGNLYNCVDFDTQPEAQACMEYCEGQGAGDIHDLDGNDDDGLACESLPPVFKVVR